MKKLVLNIIVVLVVILSAFSATYQLNASSNLFLKDGIDSTRISTVTFTVIGMDSSTVSGVQDKLKATKGVNFNFACWTDTIVFVEYDTVLTNPKKLMKVINKMGYKAKIRVY